MSSNTWEIQLTTGKAYFGPSFERFKSIKSRLSCFDTLLWTCSDVEHLGGAKSVSWEAVRIGEQRPQNPLQVHTINGLPYHQASAPQFLSPPNNTIACQTSWGVYAFGILKVETIAEDNKNFYNYKRFLLTLYSVQSHTIKKIRMQFLHASSTCLPLLTSGWKQHCRHKNLQPLWNKLALSLSYPFCRYLNKWL